MTDFKWSQTTNTVNFIDHQIYRTAFCEFYNHAMALIEETATYIDGKGRLTALELQGEIAVLYANEAMRLSTRLMQVASWLLLLRAERDNEMSADQITVERAKVSLTTPSQQGLSPLWSQLPLPLQDLVARSLHLEEQIRRLDERTRLTETVQASEHNPVAEQLKLINAKFAHGDH